MCITSSFSFSLCLFNRGPFFIFFSMDEVGPFFPDVSLLDSLLSGLYFSHRYLTKFVLLLKCVDFGLHALSMSSSDSWIIK